jgi:hypothetical protein
MVDTFNISERTPIWLALSNFYLDTELQEYDFRFIAQKIIDSPYSYEEVKLINQHEVFPVLQCNLLSVAGEWSGFDEKWLVEAITKHIKRRNAFTKIFEPSFNRHKWMHKAYWEKLDNMYEELKAQ